MNVFSEKASWTLLVGFAIMALLFCAIFIHNHLGSRFKLVYSVSLLHIVYVIAALIGYEVNAFVFMLSEPVFFIAYYVLADKYNKTAHEIPFLIRKKSVPKTVPCCIKKATFWTMMFLCIVFPTLDGYSYARVEECCLD